MKNLLHIKYIIYISAFSGVSSFRVRFAGFGKISSTERI